MASSAANSVEFGVNGTEMARGFTFHRSYIEQMWQQQKVDRLENVSIAIDLAFCNSVVTYRYAQGAHAWRFSEATLKNDWRPNFRLKRAFPCILATAN